MAERAFISRSTLVRVEKGDPGVSMGIYASVLFVLGMADRLVDLADVAHDPVGLSLERRTIAAAYPRGAVDIVGLRAWNVRSWSTSSWPAGPFP